MKRSFQSSWFDKWSWLHYLEDQDIVLCFTCARAHAENKLQWSSNADFAFVKKGFSNWKDATGKFGIHTASKCHKEAVLKLVTLPSTTKDVGESLSAAHQQEKLQRRQNFLKVPSTIRYLVRQGLPLRGHGDESDSNFLQLMKLQSEDDKTITTWLKKRQTSIQLPISRMRFCRLWLGMCCER